MQLRRGEACLPSDIKKLHVETVLWSLIKLLDSFGSRELACPPAGRGGVGAVPDGDVFGRVSSSPSALTSASSSLCSHSFEGRTSEMSDLDAIFCYRCFLWFLLTGNVNFTVQ